MTEKELKRLKKSDLIEIIYRMKETDSTNAKAIESDGIGYLYKKTLLSTLRSTLAVLTVVAAIAVLIATMLMPIMKIHGSSMFPTLKKGQIAVVLKGKNYKSGDLVAFYYGNKLLIKRVIAGPDDWISVEQNGDVYVNGKVLDEPYITKKAFGDCDQSFPLQIGDERWFLMGDNRSVSADSRLTAIGLVSEEQIVGKIILRIWPIKNFGLL